MAHTDPASPARSGHGADKIDLKKTVPGYAAQPGLFDVRELAPQQYLMIDGVGDPNTATEYADALATLYPAAYALKFFSKRALGRDYTVPPLEALWWADDMKTFTTARDKAAWRWTMMLLVPEWLGDEHASDAASAAAGRGAPLAARLRLETLAEGLIVQTLHVGPYDDEGPVLTEMHERVIPAHSLRMTGRHHEIYLSDPRRTAPGKLRTILRQPVTRV